MLNKKVIIASILTMVLLMSTATVMVSKAEAAAKSIISYSVGTSETLIIRNTATKDVFQEASDMIENTGVEVDKDFVEVLKNAAKTRKCITLVYNDVTIDVIPTPKNHKMLILIEG